MYLQQNYIRETPITCFIFFFLKKGHFGAVYISDTPPKLGLLNAGCSKTDKNNYW